MFYRVIGPMGSGKRQYMASLAKKAYLAGERVFVIVPEQATAAYERELTRLCGNGASQLVEVTNFSRLSNVVLRSVGHLARRSVTPEEKKIILSRLIRKMSPAFKHLPRRTDADSMDALYREMEEVRLAGLDGDTIGALSQSGDVSSALGEKLEEMQLLRSSFRRELEGRFSDPADEQARLARILSEYPFFGGSTVIIDQFWDFTAPQELLIRQILMQAKDVAISFVARKKEEALFRKTLLAARRCLRLAREVGCEVRDVTLDKESDGSALEHLRCHLVRAGAPFEGKVEGIHIIPCKTEADQAFFVASAIRKMVMEGESWHDFAVLYRGEETGDLLALTLEEEGIPLFVEEKKDLAFSPLARTILLAVRIASVYPGEQEVREYLNYGVFSCPEEERFYLEKYVATWSLSGKAILDGKDFVMNPDGFFAKNSAQEEELSAVNRGKRTVFDPLRRLSLALAGGTNEEKVSALVAFLLQIGAEKQVFDKVEEYKKEGLWEKAGEGVRVWNTVLERLSGIARTAGEEEASPEEFLSLLTIALSGSLPGTLPPGQDRVQMGEVSFSRPSDAKHVFFVSFAAGVFPAQEKKGGIFTQKERQVLSELGFPLSCGESVQSEETFLFYLAASFAKENLFMIYPCGDAEDGKKGSLSVFGKRVQALFPQLREADLTLYQKEEEMPLTREAAFRWLLAHAGEESPLKEALTHYFSEKEEYRERLMRALSGKAFQKEGFALREEKPYANADISMTYSRLEKYSLCRFSYFARYLLEAKDARKASFGANITGSFVHQVLEKVLSSLASQGKRLSEVSDGELEKINREFCREAALEFAGEQVDATLQMQLRQITRSTLLLLKNLREEFSVSEFQPLYFEKDLSDLGGAYEIPLSDGKKLRLFGTIDRVDVYRGKNGQDWVRVVDYKTGGHDFNLNNVANGLDLQMLLYLFALWGRPVSGGKEGAMPASVLYLNGMEKSAVCENGSDLDLVKEKPFFGLGREGLLVDDRELLEAQDPDGQGEWIPVAWNRKTVSGKNSLISLENLGRLRERVERDFARLAEEIKEGRIEENPLYAPTRGIDPCKWCENKPICKRPPESRRPYRARLSQEEIFGKEESAT